jgi:serine/threonine-protein kinase 11
MRPYTPQQTKQNEFEIFTQLQPSDISYKVRDRPKEVKQYVLGDVLGEGSYAKVRAAVDSNTQRKVAIKILKKRHLKKIPGGESSVKKEITILKRLHHRNIVELIEYFTIDEKEKMYIVLEYIDGGTLQSLIERAPNGRLPFRQSQLILRQLLEAVSYIHSEKIVHGDIKPDNLMFTEDGVLKMSDFGVAEELNDLGESDALSKSSGSPAFQPPEIASGSSMFSPTKVDVWAVGIVLYIMTVGKYPFSGSNVYTLYESISKGEYALPENQDPQLKDLLQGILQVDPRRRLSIQQIQSHTWVTVDVVDDEPFVPLGMFPPAPEERINNIFGNREQEEGDDLSYSGFFVTDEDDDLRISGRISREHSNHSTTSSTSIDSINYNSSGANSRSGSINANTTPPPRHPAKMRCIVM